MSRVRLTAFSLVLIALVAATTGGTLSPSASNGGGAGTPALAAHVPGEILIQFQPNTRALDRASARAQLNASQIRTFRGGAEHWKLGPGQSVEQAIARMKNNPHVRYAEPNYVVSIDVVPNDPRFNELYGMLNTGQTGGTADADIDADMAWGISRGSRSVIVGVIDTGVDYNHPDLAANIWTNPGEIPGNNIDDDNNGYVDDVHGYDFINHDGDPFDDNGHGTHCSGTIGAVGNNGIGVAGVNWEVTIMGLKFLSAGGSGSTADAVLATDYATMMGVALTSNSWGGGGFSQTLYDAIARANAAEIPFVAAAGNAGSNNDTTPSYPASYDLPNIIAVAATDHNDAVASFSNWGAVSVDIAAPGVNILSTQPGNLYQQLSGTSMATPHVAGAAALVKSLFPAIPAVQLKTALMVSADQKTVLNPVTGSRPVASGGRLNVFFAIAAPDDDPPGSINDLATNNPGSNTMGLSWTATGDDGSTGTATFYQVRYSASPIDEGNWSAATRAGNEPDPLPAGSAQSMEVHGLAANTSYYFAIKAFDEFGNPGPISNLATGMTLPPPTLGYTPASFTRTLLTGGTSDQSIEVRNDGPGTLDFTIPSPSLGEPMAAPQDPLILDKGEPDPRTGPVVTGSGGPDAFGYRWVDSDQPGGPAFSWVEISGTGIPVSGVTTDDSNGGPLALGFSFPFYGTFFNSIRVCSNGWLSFTSAATSYSNQPLPNGGAPENLIAPFWDDLNPGGATHIYYQTFPTRAIVEWSGIAPYTGTGSFSFQAIIESSGAMTFQYLSMAGDVSSATVGIQNATKTVGLQTAFNQSYLHDSMAVRITALPQWLTVAPTSGRVGPFGHVFLNAHIDASGLEGGTYPGTITIQNNDPTNPAAVVTASLHVIGAPDASVQPSSLDYGNRFIGLPHDLNLTVANVGTDTLHVLGITPGDASVTATPGMFDVPPHGSQNVTVRWTPAALGSFSTSLDIESDDGGENHILVPITGNAIAAPVVVVDPASLTETLYSGNVSTQPLIVSNSGGSDLIVSAAADQGNGGLGVISADDYALGNGGPDAFGYRWRDSDAAGGPVYNFIDIRSTGTPIAITGDDSMSTAIAMGMTFPFYGSSFSSLKVCTNGFVTFNTASTSCPFTNGALPSTSLPANSIALFWDDLDFRGVQHARYLYDGTRFIVQFTDVDRHQTPAGNSHLTFQVQLYPTGRVLVMYGTMTSTTTPTLNSATIGIQNLNVTTGTALQVVRDAAYMHSTLALQYSRTPDWLGVTPSGYTIPAGESRTFTVRFDSTDRAGGQLNGNIRLTTNIPGQTLVLVPATLNVIGAPRIGTVPTSINYGSVFIGYPVLSSFLVVNNGTADLTVNGITTTDPSLTVEESPGPTVTFPLPPGGSRVFNLRWGPTSAGALSAYVEIDSDDPTSQITRIAVSGNAILPPVAVVTPPSFSESIMAGDVVTRTLHLENQGNSNLVFSTAVHALGGTPVTQYPGLELKKDEQDTRPGVLGSGGPDLFGYIWKDSDEPGGPTFAWTDISGIGTPLSTLDSDDEIALNVPIGFPFSFYGNTFTTVNVNTNGWLSFTSTVGSGSTTYLNQPLPNTAGPENLLAALWDDLDFRGAVHAHYYNDGTRFIVQWTDVDRHPVGEPPDPDHLTFQAILYPSGKIVFQYLTVNGLLTSSTIGMQNATKNDGLTVVYNSAYIHANLAVEFRSPQDFLSVSPSGGTLPPLPNPGGAIDLTVRIDASILIGGDYEASIDLITNDPAHGLIPVPVHLHVTGIPDIDIQPAGSLLFPTTFTGFSSSLGVMVRNVGTDVLHITGISTAGDFTASGLTPPVDVPVGGSIPVTVTFAPTAPGSRIGDLTIESLDPDEGSVSVLLEGEALIPPEVDVTPAAISTALPPAGSRTKTLSVCNTGGSDLNWTTGVNLASAIQPGTYLELDKNEEDPRVGILGSGGPDMFGYSWNDSDEPGGPAFGWVDISTVGTPINFVAGGYCDDCNSSPIPIGFSFPFYGNSFASVRATTNGWLSFTSTATTFTNQPLPNNGSTVPENLLAAFWDDLVLRNGTSEPRVSKAYYYNDGTRFIVQYQHFYRIANTATDDLNFEVIIYPSGRIVYQYLSMTSSILNSATIGIQNAAKDDGLTTVFNAAYVHNDLAILYQSIPEWMTVKPTGGTIAVGACQDVTVNLNAAGLDDGIHEATINLSSNDPYTPSVQVPVTLNVSIVPVSSADFDPDVLNLSSSGQCVKVVVELPAGLDPHGINLSNLYLNGQLSPLGPCGQPSFDDADNDGLEEISMKFDRFAVEVLLSQQPTGIANLTIRGEVTDVQWWEGTMQVRTMRPREIEPMGGEYLIAGQLVTVSWLAPSTGTGPQTRYTVLLTRNGGTTWEILASDLAATSFGWAVGGQPTSRARIRVVATDNQGVMGYGTSAGDFTIAETLRPPNDVGETLDVKVDGGEVVLQWQKPGIDTLHGPVGYYRVLRADTPNGPFTEIGTTTIESLREPVATMSAGSFHYYRVVAVNAGGESLN
ncbi:MAG TPA: S8 family serine peptidase [Candidatus Polarisedimenticolia bacterium]